jgi:hypothetical protein
VDGQQQKAKLSKSAVLDKLTGLAMKGELSSLDVTKYEISGKLPAHIAQLPDFN